MTTNAAPSSRQVQWIAAVTGVVGFVLAVITPLLPVHQTTSELDWPGQAPVRSVTAPLVAYVPVTMSVSIPCAAVTQLPDGVGTLVATAPTAADDAMARALVIKVNGDPNSANRFVEVVVRNTSLVTATAAQLADPNCRTITFTATSTRIEATIDGLKDSTGKPLSGHRENGFDYRPQVVGVFTDLPETRAGPAAQISLTATIDTRYSTTPTLLRLLAIIVGLGAIAISLVALARLDAVDDQRRHRRIFPAHWWRPTTLDATVIALLVLWHFIGANTSDDGYILTMARTAEHAGYTANYYRWYGAPETPFGWYYEAFGLMAKVSTASPWVRIPATIVGIATWLIISREVVPRLGRAAMRPFAQWAAAGMFLVFWFGYNNGLRPEPAIALGALLTWCSIERAIATGRLLPAAMAVVFAGWTVAAGPTGVITIAALLAGARPIIRRYLARARGFGGAWRFRRPRHPDAPAGVTVSRLPYVALLAPILAAGVALVPIIFSKLTLAAFLAKSGMQSTVGTVVPTKHWFNEIDRYSALFTFTPDGNIARRLAVIGMIVCLLFCAAVILRKARIPGTSLGPSRRLVAVTFGSLLLMMFTPTKWTHQFGVFAGLGAAVAALGAIAIAPGALRLRRDRWLAGSAVLFVLALAFCGPNGWWLVSNYGVPFGTSTVVGAGVVFFALAIGAFGYAGWLHFAAQGSPTEPALAQRTDPYVPPVRRRNQWMVRISPWTWATGLVVLVCVVTMLITATITQHSSYSVGWANVRALAGKTCNVADFVEVEPNPSDGQLRPAASAAADSLAGPGTEGATSDGVPADTTSDAATDGSTQATTLDDIVTRSQDSTTGRTVTTGINGSHVELPYNLDPLRTPVLGTYSATTQARAKIVTQWFALPPASADRTLITMTAAGRFTEDELYLEYSTAPLSATMAVAGEEPMIDIGPKPSWRNLRLPRSDLPADATAIRVVAEDSDLASNHWLAITPPRMSQMHTLQQWVGSTDPVLVDWTSGLAFPCQRPFSHRDGVAEVPRWRILPDQNLSPVTDLWEGSVGGGPVGWVELLLKPTKVASYLRGDLGQDWGELESLAPYQASQLAEVQHGQRTRWGFAGDGPIRDN